MIKIEAVRHPSHCNSCMGDYDVKDVHFSLVNYTLVVCLCKACRSLLLKRLLEEARINDNA